jgi:hypothetical protein
VLGIDFNADHLACTVLDRFGNPEGRPYHIPLIVKGLPASTRDGHLRNAISNALHIAVANRCDHIACEDLGWSDETGRDELRGSRVFRAMISGFPTAMLKQRLPAMAARKNLGVIAVDPAYTSQWGAQHWQHPLTTSRRAATRHEASSVAIGRRAQRFTIRRKASAPGQDRSDPARSTRTSNRSTGRSSARVPSMGSPAAGRIRDTIPAADPSCRLAKASKDRSRWPASDHQRHQDAGVNGCQRQ